MTPPPVVKGYAFDVIRGFVWGKPAPNKAKNCHHNLVTLYSRGVPLAVYVEPDKILYHEPGGDRPRTERLHLDIMLDEARYIRRQLAVGSRCDVLRADLTEE